MGRTVRPYSHQIQQLANERFSDFRRGLPRKHQEAFDEIIRSAKGHLAAGVMASNPYSIETILLSSMIQMKLEIEDLRNQVTKKNSETEE
jgi:hypothetical protein